MSPEEQQARINTLKDTCHTFIENYLPEITQMNCVAALTYINSLDILTADQEKEKAILQEAFLWVERVRNSCRQFIIEGYHANEVEWEHPSEDMKMVFLKY